MNKCDNLFQINEIPDADYSNSSFTSRRNEEIDLLIRCMSKEHEPYNSDKVRFTKIRYNK